MKILICYHKKSVLLKDSIFTPMHCGRACSKRTPEYRWLKRHMIGDNTGDNISKKNPVYNELTAIYWAWKNYEKLGNPDYMGLMHYRRHFIFKTEPDLRYMIPSYEYIANVPDYYRSLNYTQENLSALLDTCDFICFQGKVESIYKNYAQHHPIEDLDKAIHILKKMYPDYSTACDEYMQSDTGAYYNMFIFPRAMFFEYCAWIFPLLEEFEKAIDMTDKRFFLSERLMGVFIYHCIQQGSVCRDLPISFIEQPEKMPDRVSDEEWAQMSILEKGLWYFRYNGLKSTIRKIKKHLS